MSRRLLFGLLLACSAFGPAVAQNIGEPIPGRTDPLSSKANPAKPTATAARPCPEYGPGFVRIEGSASCVRLGGSVRVDIGKSSHRGTGSAVRGMAELETRTETGLGTMRTVIRAGGTLDRNLDSGRYRY